jgi:hypothetical protein
VLFPLFVLVVVLPLANAFTGCTHYGDPRAELIVTSNRNDATIYLVPIDKELVKPFTRDALKQYNIGSTSSQRGIWVNHGYYWLVLGDKGAWSGPVEFEVRLNNLNKVHVDF